MSLFAILVWVLIGAFCIYMFIEINRTKTSAEKISLIRDEMARVDKMNQLNTRINTTRVKNYQEWSALYESSIRWYATIRLYIVQTIQTMLQLIVDIISKWGYYYIG